MQRLAKITPLDKTIRTELNDIVERDAAAQPSQPRDLRHRCRWRDHPHPAHEVEESRGTLRFGLRKPVDDSWLEEVARTIQDLPALNRRIWDLIPVLETAMSGPET